MRVAAVDCGTNSLRLLVADVDPGTGRLVTVHREARIVRLGEGVDRTGELAPEAVARVLAVTAVYARRCEEAGVERVRFVATSAARDATNAGLLVRGVHGVLGVEPEVLTGAEEARLSFVGAVRGLPAGAVPPGPCLVVDVGGGSTEVVLGASSEPDGARDAGPLVAAAVSVDVGSVRLTERHLRSDPPTGAELAAARADVTAALDVVAGAVDLARARALVGVAGTVTTITAHALGLPADDPARVHGAVLTVAAARAACAALLGATRAERAALPGMPAGRADVIGAGALVWDQVIERVAGSAGLRQVVTSEQDILDGVARALAGAATGA